GSVCTVSPSGWSPWASGGRAAARANEPSDDLEPDIKKCNQAAEPEPLKCVTVVFVDAGADHGPVAQQALAGGARLQHREGGQCETRFGAEGRQVEILPDARRPLRTVGASKLVQARRRSRHGALDLHQDVLRSLDGRQLHAVLEIAR